VDDALAKVLSESVSALVAVSRSSAPAGEAWSLAWYLVDVDVPVFAEVALESDELAEPGDVEPAFDELDPESDELAEPDGSGSAAATAGPLATAIASAAAAARPPIRAMPLDSAALLSRPLLARYLSDMLVSPCSSVSAAPTDVAQRSCG
jgi:hypothetical protein